MTDQPEQQLQPEADPDAAYEAALAGESGRDEYGLPASQVTHIEGKSIGAAAQEARAKLAAIEKLKGSTEQPTEEPTGQPTEEPVESFEGALSPEDVVDRLFGYEDEPTAEGPPLTPEQVDQLRAQQQLVSGEVTAAATQEAAAYEQAIEQLIESSPGIQTDEFIEAAEPAWERIRAAYGDEVAASPDIIRQIYESTGGEARWRDVAARNAQTEAYERALTGGGPRDSFGFPVEPDEDAGEF